MIALVIDEALRSQKKKSLMPDEALLCSAPV
jgi:hypothetical protein